MSAAVEETWEVPEDALVIVACSAAKLTEPAPARDLYTGDLFRASVRWAESWGLRWVVLSALHGIVQPDRVLRPYDFRLCTTPADRYRLSQMVSVDIHRSTRCVGLPSALVVLGGADYVDVVRQSQLVNGLSGGKATALNLPFWAPLQELPSRGVGYYRQWLSANTRRGARDA